MVLMEKRVEEEVKPKLPSIINVRLVHGRHSKKKKLITAGIVLIVLLISAGLIGWSKMTGSQSGYLNGNQYQAVFLEGGQVYFGKLQVLHDTYRLTDVYYLEPSKAPDATTEDTNTKPGAKQSPNLVKLGSELHGPEDQMMFEKQNILFWENLKSDSKVSKAIDEYRKK